MADVLRIESDDACTLAAELMALTGESLHWAVTMALRERIQRERARHAWQDRIMVITREIAMGLREPAANDQSTTRALAG
jgi:hypothetical protein